MWCEESKLLTHKDFWYNQSYSHSDCFPGAEPVLSPLIRCIIKPAYSNGTFMGDGLYLKADCEVKGKAEPVTKLIYPITL